MPSRIFGDIPGIPEGSEFENRLFLSKYGVHRPIRAGVSGTATEGANSVILSGGYEDDEDYGHTIIYAGNGGRSYKTGTQVADQQLDGKNLALAFNYEHDLPVRLIRGANPKNPFSPSVGYRYDGLFRIASYWPALGESGFIVWYFRLVKQ